MASSKPQPSCPPRRARHLPVPEISQAHDIHPIKKEVVQLCERTVQKAKLLASEIRMVSSPLAPEDTNCEINREFYYLVEIIRFIDISVLLMTETDEEIPGSRKDFPFRHNLCRRIKQKPLRGFYPNSPRPRKSPNIFPISDE
jgi:hypothetical protein